MVGARVEQEQEQSGTGTEWNRNNETKNVNIRTKHEIKKRINQRHGKKCESSVQRETSD